MPMIQSAMTPVEMYFEYAPSGAQKPSAAHVVVRASTTTMAVTPSAKPRFESCPAWPRLGSRTSPDTPRRTRAWTR